MILLSAHFCRGCRKRYNFRVTFAAALFPCILAQETGESRGRASRPDKQPRRRHSSPRKFPNYANRSLNPRSARSGLTGDGKKGEEQEEEGEEERERYRRARRARDVMQMRRAMRKVFAIFPAFSARPLIGRLAFLGFPRREPSPGGNVSPRRILEGTSISRFDVKARGIRARARHPLDDAAYDGIKYSQSAFNIIRVWCGVSINRTVPCFDWLRLPADDVSILKRIRGCAALDRVRLVEITFSRLARRRRR